MQCLLSLYRSGGCAGRLPPRRSYSRAKYPAMSLRSIWRPRCRSNHTGGSGPGSAAGRHRGAHRNAHLSRQIPHHALCCQTQLTVPAFCLSETRRTARFSVLQKRRPCLPPFPAVRSSSWSASLKVRAPSAPLSPSSCSSSSSPLSALWTPHRLMPVGLRSLFFTLLSFYSRFLPLSSSYKLIDKQMFCALKYLFFTIPSADSQLSFPAKRDTRTAIHFSGRFLSKILHSYILI